MTETHNAISEQTDSAAAGGELGRAMRKAFHGAAENRFAQITDLFMLLEVFDVGGEHDALASGDSEHGAKSDQGGRTVRRKAMVRPLF